MKIRKIGNTVYSPRGFAGFYFLASLTMLLACFGNYYFEGSNWYYVVFGLLSVLFLHGAIDHHTTKVVFEDDGLVIRSIGKTRRYPKSDITKVTWEAGCGVSLRIRDEHWEKVPDQGNSQSMCNVIRAWIKR